MFGSIFGGGFFGEIWRLVTGLPVPARLPDNIIVATQSVAEVQRSVGYTEPVRRLAVTQARRTVTFDGAALAPVRTMAVTRVTRTVTFDG